MDLFFVALLVFVPERLSESLALLFGCFSFVVTKEKAEKTFCMAFSFLKDMLLSYVYKLYTYLVT